MGNMLRAFELEERELDPDDPLNELLQACAFGIRSIFMTGICRTPPPRIFPTGDNRTFVQGSHRKEIQTKIFTF
jgi:hypothetical protein